VGRVMHALGRGDPAIAGVAGVQYGVVTHEQLLRCGLGRGAIAHRLSRGRLHRLHRGVYLVGHRAAPPLARQLAAVLACGEGAALSHRSAAELWELLPGGGAGAAVDVTVCARNGGRRPGIRVHRSRRLDSRDLTERERIPVTAPARTLLDLAETADTRELERAFDEARVRKLVRSNDLRALLARSPGRHGALALEGMLRRQEGPALTRSEAEERMLALLRRAQLPSPEINVAVGRYEVDLLWRAERLAIEVDGYAFHSTPSAFERDRRRDADLQAIGLRVMRVTWRQITEEPEALIARVARAMATGTEKPLNFGASGRL